MNEKLEQIFAWEYHPASMDDLSEGGWYSKNKDAPTSATSYTSTDVAQAMVAAAYEAAKKAAFHACKSAGAGYVDENERLLQRAENEFRLEVVTAIRALTPTDAKAALDRIVQDAVKEESRRIYKMLCDMGEAEFKVNNSHDAQLLYHAASKVAALKGGEA